MPYTYDYPHPAVATDIAIFTLRSGHLELLLIERGVEPFRGRWALPGGFLRERETLESCARRELFEETGVDARGLWQFATFSDPSRDPRERVISVAYLALLPFQSMNVSGRSDASRAECFDIEALPALAFDHDMIVRSALESLRQRVRSDLSTLFALLPDRFTLSTLQSAFEAVATETADKRNFRKMTLDTGLLVETTEFERGSHRPARLYSPI